jgi:hypothetical protein
MEMSLECECKILEWMGEEKNHSGKLRASRVSDASKSN